MMHSDFGINICMATALSYLGLHWAKLSTLWASGYKCMRHVLCCRTYYELNLRIDIVLEISITMMCCSAT